MYIWPLGYFKQFLISKDHVIKNQVPSKLFNSTHNKISMLLDTCHTPNK